MRLGGDEALTRAVSAVGASVGPRVKWLVRWHLQNGVRDWDSFFASCKADNVTPQVMHWVLGDSLSPATLATDTGPALALLTQVMQKAKAAGVAPFVVIESEFNKAGVEKGTAFAPYFDACFNTIRLNCPAAKVIFSAGCWGDLATLAKLYAPQIQKADLVGLSVVLFPPRHPATEFRAAGGNLTKGFQSLRSANPTKPGAIVDLCASSYGGAYASAPPFAGGDGKANEALQAEAIASIAAALPAMNLEFVTYRALKDDPNFSLDNYGGHAERFVAVVRADGSKKPAHAILLAMAKPAVRTFSQSEMDAVLAERDSAKQAQIALQAALDATDARLAEQAKIASELQARLVNLRVAWNAAFAGV